MQIPRAEWEAASGSLVEDDTGKLWRIIGFIDQPTVIMEPAVLGPDVMVDKRTRAYQVMGSQTSQQFHRLVRKDEA